jgi:predicted nucleic acid-binding Zn finger protein
MPLSAYETKRLSQKVLEQHDIEYFKQKYGKRFIRALRAVEEGRVHKYIFNEGEAVRWIVEGSEGDYLVFPDTFCTCTDFYQSVVIDRAVDMCYHLLAQRIAELRGEYTTITGTEVERRKFSNIWRGSN